MPAGSWSDDGSMTLCLAQSFVEQHSLVRNPYNTIDLFNREDIVRKFASWLENGYFSAGTAAFDVGRGTQIAMDVWRTELYRVQQGDVREFNVPRAQSTVNKQLGDERNSGNGSLMRCAPIPCLYHDDEAAARRVAREQSDLTHPSSVCGDACSIYASLIILALKDVSKQAIADQVVREDVSSQVLRNRLGRYRTLTDWEQTSEENIRSSGWVVDTIEAALWAFFSTANFKDGAIRAVNLGEDTDTIGAIYGGLAGAYYGYEEIPQDWREGIAKRDMVSEVFANFATLICA